MSKITFRKTSENATAPTKAYFGDIGFDLYSAEDILVPSSVQYDMGGIFEGDIIFNNATIVTTDIICEFPEGVGGIIRDRSSIATKTGLLIVAGILDSKYIGIIKIAFRNLGKPYQIKKGDKIAQMILVPVIEITEQYIWEVGANSSDGVTLITSDINDRYDSGFGSSGK